MSKKTQIFENVLIAFTQVDGEEGENAVILDRAGIPKEWLDGTNCYDNNFEYFPEGKPVEVYRCKVESWASGISGISDNDNGFHILEAEMIFDPATTLQRIVDLEEENSRLKSQIRGMEKTIDGYEMSGQQDNDELEFLEEDEEEETTHDA